MGCRRAILVSGSAGLRCVGLCIRSPPGRGRHQRYGGLRIARSDPAVPRRSGRSHPAYVGKARVLHACSPALQSAKSAFCRVRTTAFAIGDRLARPPPRRWRPIGGSGALLRGGRAGSAGLDQSWAQSGHRFDSQSPTPHSTRARPVRDRPLCRVTPLGCRGGGEASGPVGSLRDRERRGASGEHRAPP